MAGAENGGYAFSASSMQRSINIAGLEIKIGTKTSKCGGAQSDVWCQIFADVMNVEIKQVADPIYANARGAAWIAAVGLGEIKYCRYSGIGGIQKNIQTAISESRFV
ncbi:MAG: hypothetical protein OHK003_32040 [Anaerolineales bacterium]